MSTSLFDLWETPASPGAAGVAFSTAGGDEPLEAVWRVNLRGAPHAAENELLGYLDLAQASTAALDDLPERLDGLLVQGEARTRGVAFAASAPALAPAEASLMSVLDEVGRASRQMSFAPGVTPLAGWEDAYQQFQATAGRLLLAISYMAWVETRLEGQLLGRTRVGWSGDTETVYAQATSPEQAALHRRSLEVAVISRNLLLRAFTSAFAGAAKCSILLATPGGALLALPAVWKYISQVLSQVEQYQALNQPPAESPA